uniref:Uncharacterized protein n=1 Tax=Heterorhabditis bacteriophora TaxID=37862 RepID=A0A1I7WB87_HETBA
MADKEHSHSDGKKCCNHSHKGLVHLHREGSSGSDNGSDMQSNYKLKIYTYLIEYCEDKAIFKNGRNIHSICNARCPSCNVNYSKRHLYINQI